MPLPFLEFPGEIRNEIYKLLLLHPAPLDPLDPVYACWRVRSVRGGRLVPAQEKHRHPEHAPSHAVFLTNKTIHREASSILYGENWFNLATLDTEPVARLHAIIGPTNAGYVRNIIVKFPQWFRPQEGHNHTGMNIASRDSWLMAEIREYLPNVRKIMIEYPHAIVTMIKHLGMMKDRPRDPESYSCFDNMLKLFDTFLRDNWSSLTVIAPADYGKVVSSKMREEMEQHGWSFQRMSDFQTVYDF